MHLTALLEALLVPTHRLWDTPKHLAFSLCDRQSATRQHWPTSPEYVYGRVSSRQAFVKFDTS